MIFEIVAPGVPGSIGSGGRYDHLIETLGGPDVPACGASLGIERVLGLLDGDGDGLSAEVYLGSSGKLAKQLKWAADRRARFTLIYGAREREAGAVTVRDMDSGEQAAVAPDQLAAHLTKSEEKPAAQA